MHKCSLCSVSIILVLTIFCLVPKTFSDGAKNIKRLQPTDLVYKGAFRLPDAASANEWDSWEWSSWAGAMTCYPDGDPSGPDDEYPGSIFAVGHDHYQYVSEINIPVPVISSGKNLEELNTAKTLQGFADIRGGMFGELELPRVGLCYLSAQGSQSSAKLYFAWAPHLDETAQNASHGWCELNLSAPQSKGLWKIGSYDNYVTGDYIFEIPESWANTYTPGKRLATGRFRDGGQSAMGPSMIAIGPWTQGNPPANGASLSVTPLLLYENVIQDNPHAMNNYTHTDEWNGAAWITAGNSSAIVFVGTKGQGNSWYGYADGTVWPNPENQEGEGERGWWSDALVGQLVFYNPDDIAAVALGQQETYQPQPYATLDIDSYLYGITSTRQKYHVSAADYDREHGLFYVFEPFADGCKPIVHVWRANISYVPTQPTVSASDGLFTNKIQVSWTAPTGATSYELFKNTETNPATATQLTNTTSTIYNDTDVTTEATYYYWVRAGNAYGTSDYSNVESGYAGTVQNALAPVYRLYCNGAPESTYEHLWTTSAGERDTLDAWPSWEYEGVAWLAITNQVSGSIPLYRLYAPSVKQHHYTTNVVEYTSLADNSTWNGEGIQYYVFPTGTGGTLPAYRFYHSELFLHHFTIDENERAQILANPDWGYVEEGIGFCVYSPEN